MKNQISYRNPVVTYGTASLITFIVFLWLRFTGYPLFEENSSFVLINFMQAYMLPLFFVYGIMIGDLINKIIDENLNYNQKIHFAELSVVSILAFLRISTGIPISGHALIISFYILQELVEQKEKSLVKIFVGVSVLLVTIYVKIIVNDPFTFITGIASGAIIFIIGYYFKSKEISSDRSFL